MEEGFLYTEAESVAGEVLYRDLHFFKYETLVSVLGNEFEKELPFPLPKRLSWILLGYKAIQNPFDTYNLTDEFVATPEYDTPLRRTDRNSCTSYRSKSIYIEGRSGKVIGTNYVTDFGGNVVKESDLGDCNFGLNVIGNPEGITIDYLANTITVAEGGTATFYLQANTGFGQP